MLPVGSVDMYLNAAGPDSFIDLYFGVSKIGSLVAVKAPGLNDL
jgi:hypothetical protein